MSNIESQEKIETITINGREFVAKDQLKTSSPAEALDGMKYVIVRTFSAGVFAGYLKSRTGQEVVLKKARRLWYWEGAASLSQLAQSGVSKPQNCKFPEEVDQVELLNAIEILDVSKEAQLSIAKVKVWKV